MSRFLRWVPDDKANFLREATPLVASSIPLIPTHSPRLQPRDEAVFLLQLAAEIEHALLVQYLFGMYTIKLDGFTEPHAPANAPFLADSWRQAILLIAMQEMGHLMTVQNLLLFLGGPIHFARPVFPQRTDFYPFDFELEEISKDSLAKYVAAEMPPIRPDSVLREIIFRARGAAGGHFVNRVGALYEAIGALFAPCGPLTDDDFDFDSIDYQADPQHWRLSPGFLLLPIRSREDAHSALKQIAEQGEGPTKPPLDGDLSHFALFLQIYFNSEVPADSFPESDPVISPVEWTATLPVLRNPVVNESGSGSNVIRDPFTYKWAQLFNLRYRILLTCLSHYLYLPGNSLRRQQLASFATFEMRTGTKRLAKLLVKLPAGPDATKNAGPTFEIDYDLTMPHGEQNRWRLQRDVVLASKELILELRRYIVSAEQKSILDSLDANDGTFLQFIEDQIS